MTDVYSLRQQLSSLVDQIKQDVDRIDATRDLSSKHRVEKSINDAKKLANDLTRLDQAYGRNFNQQINENQQRLENISKALVHNPSSFDSDPEVNRLGQEQRGLLTRGYESMVRTGETLRNAHEIARETEQIGHSVMSDLNDQRESLLRTQNKLSEGNENIKLAGKTIRLMYRRVIFNKVILVTIIFIELIILGVVIYLKFFLNK